MKMHFPLTLELEAVHPRASFFLHFSTLVIGSETKRCQAFEKNDGEALTPGKYLHRTSIFPPTSKLM